MRINELKTKWTPKGHMNFIEPKSFDALEKFIQKNCSNILEVYEELNFKSALFRNLTRFDQEGVFVDVPEVNAFVSSSRNNRAPKDTPERFQKLIDGYLKKEGFKALRSNSIFCTSSRSAISQYGPASFIIFPFNSTDYTWSEKTSDLFQTLWLQKEPMPYGANTNDEKYEKLLKMGAKQFHWKYFFRKTRINQAIKKGHEVYIHGKYVAVNVKETSFLARLGFRERLNR